jgi:ATP-dependent exoDNAse (exonuclease V) beta subunit
MADVRTVAPDQPDRAAAVAERRRNVLVDAGAGTGKTTILVDRLVEMLAPAGGGVAVPIGRIAAITFTRKAAGELRLRIRERLLEVLAGAASDPPRTRRLHEALTGLDTAYVGTIHSFTDRLLRLHPVEADLSPSYEVVDDEDALVHETFEVLMQAVQNDTLADELGGTAAAARAPEAARAILDALACGVDAGTRELEWGYRYGLDALVAGFVRARDVWPPDVEPPAFDFAAFRAAAGEFVTLTTGIRPGTYGANWLVRVREELGRLQLVDDAIEISHDVRMLLDQAPRDPRKGHDFGGDAVAWDAWKTFDKGEDRARPLKDDLRAPRDAWLARRLMRIFPVVVALYEKVKARRRTLDQLDLLAKLRDLLRDKLDVRGEYQRMFDHLFVDEFQDTDPLQAEIVLYLAEREPQARRWEDVMLADDRLTLVGDPKQSIYRFRRADVAMYDRVREVVDRGGPLHVRLAANFRSLPPLIAWLNDRFRQVLGVSPDGRPFDRDSGRVFQQDLLPGREGAGGPNVHVLPFDFADGGKHNVDDYRELEGQALACYLRWLVGASGLQITDPLDRRRRPVGYGDVAVLAVSTYRLPLLFPSLDAAGIPYASRGGALFLQDPLHRRFLLGLRALADRDDGVAEAALLRPPFFAVDLLDLLQEQAARAEEREPSGEGERRAREARDLVRDFRRRRFDRPPGATARDLLEHTLLGRAVALGPNGAQRLARLRELCLVLEQLAAAEGLDFDAATARVREWVDDPTRLDPPHPVGADAVQVLTVHQAKGLEFPVVVLWDGKGTWDTRLQPAPWRMERDGRGWMMGLATLTWEEPPMLGLRATEERYLDAERRRVVYVAATRARDLLVVPRPGGQTVKMICGELLAGAPAALMRELPLYRSDAPPAWAREPATAMVTAPADGDTVEREVLTRWGAAAIAAARPRFSPASVTGEAHRDDDEEVVEAAAPKPREGRFGSVFGTAVHLALGIVVRDPTVLVDEAVRRGASLAGLADRLAEAAGDVSRALAALGAEGLLAVEHAIEYPIADAWDGGRLLSGYVDLVAVDPEWLSVIDFKTDAPPAGAVEATYPEYARQVRTYARLLASAGVVGARRPRCGLLFTAAGEIHWVGEQPRA